MNKTSLGKKRILLGSLTKKFETILLYVDHFFVTTDKARRCLFFKLTAFQKLEPYVLVVQLPLLPLE